MEVGAPGDCCFVARSHRGCSYVLTDLREVRGKIISSLFANFML